ncbi:MAG: hypothetical protein E6K70_03185 [Planctomycetota bacterium]|nr:MAG: hypothetical protein E6K70_03185 [Planctomycetota bacterium]
MFPCVALVVLQFLDVANYNQFWHRDYALALKQAQAAAKALAVFIGSKQASPKRAASARRCAAI